MDAPVPVMPVSAIKHILLKEHADFMAAMRERIYRFEYNVYLLNAADTSTINRIEICTSYDDLEKFINESRSMSLDEWVNSL